MSTDDPRWWKVRETDEWVKCETCQHDNAIGVASVPGIPYSAAYCEACIKANAHPWWLLVANTADIGRLEDSADWWQQMVHDTCARLGRTVDQFNAEVAQALADEQ